MPYKSCPNCNSTSYSASDNGIWYCPYCGSDITFIKGVTFDPDQSFTLKEDRKKKVKDQRYNSLKILPR